jgi:hypothetical protein
MDEGLRMRTRESWYQKYTNAVLALNQLLKDLQYKEYEKRLRVVEESRRLRRMVLSGIDARKRFVSLTRRVRGAGSAKCWPSSQKMKKHGSATVS